MEKSNQEAGNKIIELDEGKETKKEGQKTSQTPQKSLRNTKKVNYSQFFSEDVDNSEEYESPEDIKNRKELNKKRQRKKPTPKPNTEPKIPKKKKTQKEENEENKEENKDINKEETKETKNKNNNNSGPIINITEILSKYNDNDNIPNSEIILILLEICLNSSQFGIDKDNSSRAFWEEVGKKPELKKITDKFKPETLRKYWRTIRETKKFKKIISEIKKYKNELNNQNMKLFAGIHAVCEYVSNPGRKMEFYLNKHMTKVANKSKITVNDMSPVQQIEDIVNTIKKYFPKKNEKEIGEILAKNNFDIENTFLVLKDAENFENLCFTEEEDAIIKKNYEDKDDNNEEYQNLINTKGLEEVLRRKEFLFNIQIDRSQYQVKEEEGNKEEDKMVLEVDDNN